MSKGLNFDIKSHDPETECMFMIKAKMIDNEKMQLEIEFYGKYDNIISSFISSYMESEDSRELIRGIMNGLTMNKINEMLKNGEIEEIDPEQENQDKKSNNKQEGDSLSS